MSKIDLNQLNDIQYDVLKEIGNIGAGNATTAYRRCSTKRWICQYLRLNLFLLMKYQI